MRIDEAHSQAASALSASGVAEPRMTAAILLAFITRRDRAYLIAHPEAEIATHELARYRDAIRRRALGEPLQYITGVQGFYGLEFEVSPAVLVPRPETEFVVDAALKHRGPQNTIIDIGTGSGCIAVTLATRLPDARIVALDISEGALAVAQRNAQKHGVFDCIEFVESDLFSAFEAADAQWRADCIVSNPPYVSRRDESRLQREVRDFEPDVALYGGEQGTEFLMRLLQESPKWMNGGGVLITEIGYDQEASATQLARELGWTVREVTKDLQGIARVLTLDHPSRTELQRRAARTPRRRAKRNNSTRFLRTKVLFAPPAPSRLCNEILALRSQLYALCSSVPRHVRVDQTRPCIDSSRQVSHLSESCLA